MYYLAKINRGVVLTAIVLIAVVIYLISVTITQNAENPKIEDICKKYIQTEVSYRMLPQKYRIDNPQMPKEEQDKYISDMTNNIKAYYSDNTQSSKYLIENLKNGIENQAKGLQLIFNYQKEFVEFKDINFDNDRVSVTITSNTSFDGYNANNPGKNRDKIHQLTDDLITLQKISGEWKVTYANINIPMNSDLYQGNNIPAKGIG